MDAERVQQAIIVLIDNAAKFSPPGAAVTLSAVTAGGWLQVAVEDRGPGIPADVLPFIFERFYRGDRTRGRRSGGAGLGLSIARAIVDAHGGRIEAAARPQGGTSMRIGIPLREAPSVLDERSAPMVIGARPGRPSPIPQLSGPRTPTRPA
jgi:signal transduction histidine kinase